MASRIQGITVEIGGDTTKLTNALKGVNSEIRNTQSQLRDVEKLLKLDPSNTELLSQKQRLLNKEVEETKEKLEALKVAREQANAALEEGAITKDQYDGLQREIIATEQALKDLETQAEQSAVSLQKISATGTKFQEVGGKIESVGKSLLPASAAMTGVGVAGLKVATDFEKAMSGVKAITGATGEEFEKLRETAIDLGATTAFSSGEVAEAMTEMAKAGPLLIIVGKVISLVGTIMTLLPKLTTLITTVKTAFSALSAVLLANPIALVIAAIAALVAAFIYLWNNCEEFRQFWLNLWEKLKSIILSALNFIQNNAVKAFQNLWNGIKNKVSGIKETIVSGFNSAVSFITGLAKLAYTWGTDIIDGIVRGIRACISKVKNAVTDVANTIRSFLHFSVPDEGPLTDYESWMPDFMSGLAKGIEKSKNMVTRAVEGLASDMVISPQMESRFATPSDSGYGGMKDSLNGIVSAITEAMGQTRGLSGDIVIPIYLGGTMLDEVVVNAQQRTNLRSGGR